MLCGIRLVDDVKEYPFEGLNLPCGEPRLNGLVYPLDDDLGPVYLINALWCD